MASAVLPMNLPWTVSKLEYGSTQMHQNSVCAERVASMTMKEARDVVGAHGVVLLL